MNKKLVVFILASIFVFVVLHVEMVYAKDQYFYSVGYDIVWKSYTPHLKVFFLIPDDATRIDKNCLVSTSFSNHGHVSNWNLSLRYVGGNKDLATLLVPKTFWGVYGRGLASQLFYLRVRN